MSEVDDWLGVSINDYVSTVRQNAKSFDVIWSDPELVRKYPQKWIAAFDGKVQLVEDDVNELLRKLVERNVPRGHAVIEYVEVNPRTLSLHVKRRIQDHTRKAVYSRTDSHYSSFGSRNDLVSCGHSR